MPGFKEELLAYARFTGATGANLAVRGCTVARTGAGDYNVTLDGGGIDATECSIDVMAEGVPVEWAVVHTSDTVKQLLALNNAAAATDPTTVVVKVYRNAFGSGL